MKRILKNIFGNRNLVISVIAFACLIFGMSVISSITGTYAYGSERTVSSIDSAEIVNPDVITGVKNGTSISDILDIIKSQIANIVVKFNVTYSDGSSSSTSSSVNINSVKWGDPPSSYSSSSKSAQTVTWDGFIPGTVTYEGKTTSLSNSTVSVTVSVLGDSDILNYDKVKSKVDTDDSDLTIKSSMKDSAIKKILANISDTTTKKAVEDAVAAGEDTITLIIYVSDYDDEDDVEDAYDGSVDKFEDKADDKDAKIANYFDLELYVDIGGKEYGPITDIGSSEVKLTYTIPSDVKTKSSSSTKHTRYYRVYGYHTKTDKVENASGDWSSGTSLTIETSLFSPFATMYYDEYSDSSSRSSSALGSVSSSRSTAAGAAGGTTPTDTIDTTAASGSRAPKTGDKFDAKKWIFFLVIGVVVALCSFILYQDTREFYDESDYAKAKKAKATADVKK